MRIFFYSFLRIPPMEHINLPQKMEVDLFEVFHDYFEKLVNFALFLDVN